MGSTKGKWHKMWKQEEKLHIVKLYLEEGMKPKELQKQYGVNASLVCVWAKQYKECGEERLKSQNGIKRN